MTHELKQIFKAFAVAKSNKQKAVLATVVSLDGSSYRRPGVRMLLLDDGSRIGAVSGGCVEKEVFRQAESVFKSNTSKVMTYDGRYRLGCEGILYILLEPFNPSRTFIKSFEETLRQRTPIFIQSYFENEYGENEGYGSVFKFEEEFIPLKSDFSQKPEALIFEQTLNPCFKLVVIGTEHDAVQLCSFASITGWEITVVASPKEEKSIEDFPGALHFITAEANELEIVIDDQTALILMTHSYVRDLQYLISLKDANPAYFGLLGPARRREKLFNELLEHTSDITEDFLDKIHGPAGIDIGAETPQEISIAIMSEILAVTNKRSPILLKEREGRIHT